MNINDLELLLNELKTKVNKLEDDFISKESAGIIISNMISTVDMSNCVTKCISNKVGYIKLPSGVVLQWKEINNNHKSDDDILFPCAFKNECWNVQVTSKQPNSVINITYHDRCSARIYKSKNGIQNNSVEGFLFAVGI